MKKTVVILFALGGCANAAWWTGNDANLYEVTESVSTVTTMEDAQNVTSDYQLKAKSLGETPSNQNFAATIDEYILRGGKKVVVMDRWQSDSTNLDLTIKKLTIEAITVTTPGVDGGEDTVTTYNKGNVTVNAAQKLTVNSISGSLETLEIQGAGTFTAGDSLALTSLKTSGSGTSVVNFGTKGDFKTTSQLSLSLGTSLTLGAVLSDENISALKAGNNVGRTLITTDKLNGVTLSKLSESLTLNLSGIELQNKGVIYSVTTNDGTTYYDIKDVTLTNGYVTVNATAKALSLVDGAAYIVVGGTANKDASMKTISYLATAPIPEPTTATLSLLALAGLAARRRRR